MKHLKVCQNYSSACHIFNSLLVVPFGDETLHLMLDVLLEFHFEFSSTLNVVARKVFVNAFRLSKTTQIIAQRSYRELH